MKMDDNEIDYIIHCLTLVVTQLKSLHLDLLALKIEEIRELILIAIRDDDEK